ncbi:alpha 1,2-mannosyltransferase 2.4.1 [Tulasnella sp. JGI-2019a]|nr:alpha 1,2-mannosyltransferase 2.4.1 [Tulasnella sp. JGI-2019a]KAG9023146.1 alpha 1,2-mannosyltransferase 2.4.1 [Tulasnella sp. JGI-2019a]
MHAPTRYLLVILGAVIGLHFILSVSHQDYGRATSIDSLKSKILGDGYSSPHNVPEEYYNANSGTNGTRKANAAFVILARNGDLEGVLFSIKQNEDRFNKRYGYPYVFLNEEPFSEDFKKFTTEVVSTKTYYGLIPHDHWYQPAHIDETKAAAARKMMEQKQVIYGGSLPYRNMCRYNSGFFFRHELLKTFDYYWRIEPHVKFFCDLNYDPFLYMQDHKKKYGFTISLPEYGETIETLWETTKAFVKQHPEYIPEGNALKFLSDDNGETYNRCHFWSNFEIGDLNFWRGEAYMKYFEFLDAAGGFYYERWGDAPVHSIGAALFLKKEDIHFFNEVGYKHDPFMHCPTGDVHARGKCWCDQNQNFDYEWYSCLNKFEAA